MAKNGNNPQNRPQNPSSNPASTTPVRNSPVPRNETISQARPGQGQRREVTTEQIAKRAYEIWKSGKGGSDLENWIRAERELRGAS
jgi:hypothetical protein